jgi:DNA-binding beta-propeller fold protein YncE
MRITTALALGLYGSALATTLAFSTAFAGNDDVSAFVPQLINSSTIPDNGDLNPYGVAFVPEGFPSEGTIAAHDVLVSNFNNSANLQGTGTTIIKFRPVGALAPPGAAESFFASSQPGLSTALGVLRAGFVIVGNVPTTDGTSATVGQGTLQVIDRRGRLLDTWADPVFLNGPWDLALDDDGARAHIFVSNVLGGTVARLDVVVTSGNLTVLKKTIIAAGYTHRTDPAALVLGPTGLALDESTDTLYVASTADNAIFAVDHASHRSTAVNKGSLVFSDVHLRGPLALRFAPNGHLLTANGDAVNADLVQPSEIVEFTKQGRFVRQYNVDASQGGAFGLDTERHSDDGFNYAAIDDVTNSLSVYRLPVN